MRKVIVVGLSIAAAWSVGCGGASGGVGTSAGGGAAAGASAGEPVPTVALQGYVHESSGTDMSGVEVCQEGTPGAAGDACAQSGPDGSFTLAAVPANELVSLTFHKDGFLPTRRSVLTGDQDVRLPQSDDSMLPATSPATFLGVAADATRGHIAFQNRELRRKRSAGRGDAHRVRRHGAAAAAFQRRIARGDHRGRRRRRLRQRGPRSLRPPGRRCVGDLHGQPSLRHTRHRVPAVERRRDRRHRGRGVRDVAGRRVVRAHAAVKHEDREESRQAAKAAKDAAKPAVTIVEHQRERPPSREGAKRIERGPSSCFFGGLGGLAALLSVFLGVRESRSVI